MAKAQGKKAVAKGKGAVKKVAARAKTAARAAKKKIGSKKPAAAVKKVSKPAARPVKRSKPSKPSKPSKRSKPVKSQKSPAKKAAAKVKAKTKAVPKATKKVVAKVAKPVKAAAPKAKAAALPRVKPALPKVKPAAVPKTAPAAPKAAVPAAIAKPIAPRPAAPEPEKKRGRRARPRVHSSGAPVAAWLSTEKPRPASFIPAPPRAEAPSAVAAPPASSDRLIRPDDIGHPAVRTVPVRIDIEQGAGRFYAIANPMEVTVRVGEGIEWDFRYIGGADVTVEEIVIEFEKPSPFAHAVFKTHKPGGARPHRQLSDGALPAAAGRRVQYTVRAITPFKTELASTKVWVTITS